MGRIAFVFSGQGAQYPGMGQELYEKNSAGAEVLRRLEAIRPGTLEQCFHGTKEELATTINTQPCMFAVEMAAAAALQDAGISCDRCAGFSLGEIAALTFSGAVSLEDGFAMVCRRAELMQAAAEQVDGGMVAVVKLEDAEVERLCAQFQQVYPVNYNCPGQVAVAGAQSELADFSAAVKQAGGRAIPLKVRGGFHSPFMAPAAEAFGQYLAGVQLAQPKLPLYSNCTGLPYEDGQLPELLARQICSPVRWKEIVRHMIDSGVDTFVELGPGKTLCGLIAKTDASMRTLHVEDMQTLAQTVAEGTTC